MQILAQIIGIKNFYLNKNIAISLKLNRYKFWIIISLTWTRFGRDLINPVFRIASLQFAL